MTNPTLYDYCKNNDKEYILNDWDYELNQGLDPTKLTYGSNKVVWWKCSFCGHRWKSSIYNRAVRSTCCPVCYYPKRKNFCKNNNLTITNPNLIADWDQSKNVKLTPDMFTKDSRYKAWWKCHICGKEVQKEIKSYAGCRNCKKQLVLNDRNMTITHPQLLKEWNYNRNQNISPENFLPTSPKKVWWKCNKCGYEWQARISNRAILNRACPCCSNKKVVKGINDLATTHPDIAKEWHTSKNGILTPDAV